MNADKKIYHLQLEPYQERYTEWLNRVEIEAFTEGGFEVETFDTDGDNTLQALQSGEVLDEFTRPSYALYQVRALMLKLQVECIKRPLQKKAVYLSDFFTPGIESLFYNRLFDDVKLYAFWWAQTVDVFDFTYKRHLDWMRSYERMVLSRIDKVFVGSFELADRCIVAFPEYADKFVNVDGLPFSVSVAFEFANIVENPVEVKNIDVVYSSRFDAEKNPHVFLDLVEMMPDKMFAICTGSGKLRGDEKAVRRVNEIIERKKNLLLFTGLSKQEYYKILRQSKIQFNCAMQDWVSFTLLEAVTFGCTPVYPMFRSFPAALDYRPEFMYRFNDPKSAADKIFRLLQAIDSERVPFERPDILKRSEKVMSKVTRIIGERL